MSEVSPGETDILQVIAADVRETKTKMDVVKEGQLPAVKIKQLFTEI